MFLKEGTLLKGGTYKIIRFIASGGFGCTYEAIHLMLNKSVAIKEFFPKTFCNRDSDTSHVTVGTQSQHALVKKLKHKFVNEAQSIAQLSHPGIVKVTDVFEENGTAYYVMDYIEGKSLGSIVDEKGKLTEAEALSYIHQLCNALEYVHNQNRLHLDIKPGNIMVDTKGRTILIDFGASKQYDEENGENTSTLIGKTPGFAPIEQMGNDVSHFRPATDIYSIGATLYKCLSGKIPIEPNLRVQGEELEVLPSEVSEPTKKAIEAAMELNPKKRPQTIRDFVSILDHSDCNMENNKSEDQVKVVSEKKSSIASNVKTCFNSISPNIPKTSNQTKSPSSSSDPNQTSQSEDSPKEEKLKSSKNNIIIGIGAAFIIALLCWMAFGGTKNSISSLEEDKKEITLASDSLTNPNNPNDPLNSQNQLESTVNNLSQAKEATIELVPPTNVKVGEEFKVVYRLLNGQGVDFKVKDINGCIKISGPMISETKNGLDYVFTYKAEKEGSYSIPSASIKVEGKDIKSNTSKFSVQTIKSQTASEVNIPNKEPLTTPAITMGTINGHEWVDFGLPSGLKWATCNVGASKPEDYGSYFAWGETSPRPPYTEDNSETCGKDNEWLQSNDYTKGNGNLTFTHDAARQNWGGSWRMPTKEEIDELKKNTTTEWGSLNGTWGCMIKGKNNNNSIFLPAAGCFNGNVLSKEGGFGHYWGSTQRGGDSSRACNFFVSADGLRSSWTMRYSGCTIRPVTE